MPYKPKLPDPSVIVKIEVIELPSELEKNEGLYEMRLGSNPKKPVYYDIIDMKKELEKLMPNKGDDIIDRLQNFRKAYLNLKTGEITS
jgi:hypothetical protein